MFTKLNMKGVSHHFLLPIMAVLVIAGIGGYVMQRSSSAAAATKSCSAALPFGRYKHNPAYAVNDKYKPCVKAIQRKVGTKLVDGIYGDYTQSRVKLWQKNHGIKNADGVVGSVTWGKMGLNTEYSTALTKRSCNAKNGYVWASGKCENRKAVCTHNGYNWSESKKNCIKKTANATSTEKSKTTAYAAKAYEIKIVNRNEYPIRTTVKTITHKNVSKATLKKYNDANDKVRAKQNADDKRYNLSWDYLTTGMSESTLYSRCAGLNGTVKSKSLGPNSKYKIHSTVTADHKICGN